MTAKFEDHCWKDIVPDSVLEIYKHYHRDTFVGPDAAVLAIDLYELAYQGGARPVEEVTQNYPSSCGIHAYEAIKPTVAVFEASRAAGLPIIYTTSDTRPSSRPGAVRATNRRGMADSPDVYKIRPEFEPQRGDLIITKQRASAFHGTPLTTHLVQLGIKSLIIFGESTSGCVRASAVDAFSAGFHVTLVEECCFDRSLLSHKINLFDLHHKYADVMHVDEVLTGLGRMKLKEAM
jgi:maleamate amidohydrolase